MQYVLLTHVNYSSLFFFLFSYLGDHIVILQNYAKYPVNKFNRNKPLSPKLLSRHFELSDFGWTVSTCVYLAPTHSKMAKRAITRAGLLGVPHNFGANIIISIEPKSRATLLSRACCCTAAITRAHRRNEGSHPYPRGGPISYSQRRGEKRMKNFPRPTNFLHKRATASAPRRKFRK